MRYVQSGHKYGHREVAAQILGRPLRNGECVHHIDNDGKNNDPTNLVICPSQQYHMELHARERAYNAGVSYSTHAFCSYHKKWEPFSEFSTYRDKRGRPNARCKEGTNLYRKEKGLTLRVNRRQ